MSDLVRSVPQFSDELLTQRLQQLCNRLSLTCQGRESHSTLFELKAVRVGSRVSIAWCDRFTSQAGALGLYRPSEAKPLVSALYTQLREWRAACEAVTAKAKAKGAAA